MKNELAGDIALAKGKTQYDTYCKRILANKMLAKGRSVEEIADELEEDEAIIRRILKNIE